MPIGNEIALLRAIVRSRNAINVPYINGKIKCASKELRAGLVSATRLLAVRGSVSNKSRSIIRASSRKQSDQTPEGARQGENISNAVIG